MARPYSIALLAILAACSQEPDSPPAPERELSAATAPEVDSAPSATSDETPDGADPEGSALATDGLVSRYTRFDLAACEILREERVEGSFADYRCPGLPGIPLLVQEGDGRFDLDAGTNDDAFQTIGAFNDIGDTVEWRMRDGAPFAVVFRFLDRAMIEPGRTVLAVEKVGTAGSPGCRVAQIAGDTPDANVRARALADRRAAGFRCGTDETLYIGRAR